MRSFGGRSSLTCCKGCIARGEEERQTDLRHYLVDTSEVGAEDNSLCLLPRQHEDEGTRKRARPTPPPEKSRRRAAVTALSVSGDEVWKNDLMKETGVPAYVVKKCVPTDRSWELLFASGKQLHDFSDPLLPGQTYTVVAREKESDERERALSDLLQRSAAHPVAPVIEADHLMLPQY
ncbi:unnamed protein product [Amoebophrya sp. A25]|nr:unnamed protein product [Amoebophrya sp. A25]|eukprot:GSA25T00026643001.1